MPAVDAIIVVAIVAAFVIFAGVPAWVEHRTRNLSCRFDPRETRGDPHRVGELGADA